jgi:hypothetical protein
MIAGGYPFEVPFFCQIFFGTDIADHLLLPFRLNKKYVILRQ